LCRITQIQESFDETRGREFIKRIIWDEFAGLESETGIPPEYAGVFVSSSRYD
jgi:hypothetical protein